LPCILGVPAVGQHAGGQTFDGKTEVAVFPGDLPADPNDVFAENAALFRGLAGAGTADTDFRFVRFRPPALETGRDGAPALPHIRLDRALQFLIGDRL
jgi:predicted YcjX-like family ATPase